MSVAFSSARPRSKGEVTQQAIQKMLDENHHLIQCIMDYQSKGKTAECTQYQQILHRNLVYLATIADSNQNMQSLLPAPPTPNMSMGAGGMGQGGGQHTPGNLNDNMATGLHPTAMMQSQMSNGPGHAPGHAPMQQQQQPAVPSSSLSLPASGYGSSAAGYGHTAPSSSSSSSQAAMIQGTGPGYGSSSSSSSSSSRSNLNMQSNQVSMMHQQPATPHYSSAQAGGQHYQGQQAMGMMAQGSQGNSMMSQRPLGSYRSSSQQGHGEYSYQQSSYGEQGYDRSFDESSQHYYEGGNSQYSQQQAQYQQGSGQQQQQQQQSYSQQQYSSQQGYSGQPQGYGQKRTCNLEFTHIKHMNESNVTPLLQARVDRPSILSISRVRANSTAPTAPPREAPEGPHRGPMPTNRVSMEIISNRRIHIVFPPFEESVQAVDEKIWLHQIHYPLINHHSS